MSTVDFKFNPGKKTNVVLKDLLNNFSTSQIYGIIWSGVTSATRYLQEGNITRRQATNSVITNCQRYGEKALLENWNVKHFNRTKNCQQSVISKYFFNRVMQIGDAGFTEIPRVLFKDEEK